MANTTSGTVTFDKTFAVDDIIAESYERIGLQATSGNQLRAARRSLNILFQEWGNRGLHYWEVGDTNIDLVEGQAEYTFYRASSDGTSSTTVGGTTGTSTYGVADVLEATYRNMGYNKEEMMKSVGTMHKAFQYGAPPHGGIAWGVDRLMMILEKKASIREVMAFPKTGSSEDLLFNAPSILSDKKVEEMNVRIIRK